MTPEDLLTMVLSVAQAWFWAAEGAGTEGAWQSWPAEQLARHRAAVVEAARRISGPEAADGSSEAAARQSRADRADAEDYRWPVERLQASRVVRTLLPRQR